MPQLAPYNWFLFLMTCWTMLLLIFTFWWWSTPKIISLYSYASLVNLPKNSLTQNKF